MMLKLADVASGRAHVYFKACSSNPHSPRTPHSLGEPLRDAYGSLATTQLRNKIHASRG